MLDTKGIDKVIPNVVEKLEEGNELKNALLTVMAEENEEVAQKYYDRLAEHWSVNNGNIENINPKYLLYGTV